MRGLDLVAPALSDAGIVHVFGLIGDSTFGFVTRFDGVSGPRFLGSMHENSAVSAALAYARIRGTVGVVTTTLGPGLTNAVTGLRAAVLARVPLVMLAGGLPAGATGHVQYVDQDAVFRSTGARVEHIAGPGDMGAAVTRALRTAAADRCVVGLTLPVDLQQGEVDDVAPVGPAAPDRPAARGDVEEIEQAARLLERARRPVVLAGQGAVWAGAGPALEALAERAGALLATSLPANGLFAANPWSVGISGGFSTPAAADLLGRADLVLAFGAGLNEWTLGHGHLYSPDTDVVQVDVDPARLPAGGGRVLPILGDARSVAVALTAQVGRRPPGSGFRDLAPARLAAARRPPVVDDRSTATALDPHRLFHDLDGVLPAERTLVTDGGHFLGFAVAGLPVPDVEAFHFGASFGSIGLGLGAALGAAMARPDRLTVAVVGDGGLAMALGDLQTLVRYALPVLVVVVNDGAYGAELHQMEMAGLSPAEAILGDVDFAAVARAMGAKGFTARTAAQLPEVRSWLQRPAGPCLLDCKVTTDVRATWLTRHARARQDEVTGAAR